MVKQAFMVKATEYADWPCAVFEDADEAIALAHAMHRDEDDLTRYVEAAPALSSTQTGCGLEFALMRHDDEIDQLQAVTDMICEEMDAKDAYDSGVLDGRDDG